MDKTFYVYLLASARYGTLYIGVTSNWIKRVWEHREGIAEGFTKEHGVKQSYGFPPARERRGSFWEKSTVTTRRQTHVAKIYA